jgi:hypothetical protein
MRCQDIEADLMEEEESKDEPAEEVEMEEKDYSNQRGQLQKSTT